jgi:hypothetical protein
MLQFFISAFNEDYQISEDIRNGLINQFLLKPINYFLYRFTHLRRRPPRHRHARDSAAPHRAARPHRLPHLSRATSVALALRPAAMALSAMIQFSIAYCFGMLTFWFLEIQGFVILSMAVETVLGGQMFPLDLLPAWAFRDREMSAVLLPDVFPRRDPHRPPHRPRRDHARLPSPGFLGRRVALREPPALDPRPPPPHRRRRLSGFSILDSRF